MYTVKNFPSKKALKQAVADWYGGNGEPVILCAPGLGTPKDNGVEYVEGPHYPKPHSWYAEVTVQNGIVVKVK